MGNEAYDQKDYTSFRHELSNYVLFPPPKTIIHHFERRSPYMPFTLIDLNDKLKLMAAWVYFDK